MNVNLQLPKYFLTFFFVVYFRCQMKNFHGDLLRKVNKLMELKVRQIIQQLGLDNCNINLLMMDKIYNNFYAFDDEIYSSNSEYDFQTNKKDELFEQVEQNKESKIICGTIPSTANTSNNYTQYLNSQHFSTYNKINEINPSSPSDVNIERSFKLKCKRENNNIETRYRLMEKRDRSFKGDRQETVNLNKYYSTCLKDYLCTLATCNIIQTSELQKYQQVLDMNELSSVQLDPVAEDHCLKYIQSSELVSSILRSSKMKFYNKIIAIKYANVFDQKIKSQDSYKKQWKGV